METEAKIKKGKGMEERLLLFFPAFLLSFYLFLGSFFPGAGEEDGGEGITCFFLSFFNHWAEFCSFFCLFTYCKTATAIARYYYSGTISFFFLVEVR